MSSRDIFNSKMQFLVRFRHCLKMPSTFKWNHRRHTCRMENIWNTVVKILCIAIASRVDGAKLFLACRSVFEVRSSSNERIQSNSFVGCRVSNDNVTFSKRYYRHREHIFYSCPENQTIPPSNNKSIRCLHGNLSSTPVCQPSKFETHSSTFSVDSSITLFQFNVRFHICCSYAILSIQVNQLVPRLKQAVPSRTVA